MVRTINNPSIFFTGVSFLSEWQGRYGFFGMQINTIWGRIILAQFGRVRSLSDGTNDPQQPKTERRYDPYIDPALSSTG
jgi:hypothetical protein